MARLGLVRGKRIQEAGERLGLIGGVRVQETSAAVVGFKPYFVQDNEVLSGMKKNVAGQTISAQMITISDGSDFTGTVTVTVTKDGGTQTAGGGTVTHEGGGEHSYAPTQAETNADFIAFSFSGTGALTNSKPVYTAFPQTVDNDTKISLIPTTAMRGTDSAATSAKQDTMETTLNAIPTTAMRGTDSAATSAKQDTMETTLNAIPTTAMRGTDNAATATALATAQLDLDTITGSDGATLATSQPNEDFGAVRKNAAFSNFTFLMVLASDHVTPATGLTVTGQRSLNGGAFSTVAGTITEVSNGIYQFDALAADTNGDVITWRFSSGTADDTFVTFKTVA